MGAGLGAQLWAEQQQHFLWSGEGGRLCCNGWVLKHTGWCLIALVPVCWVLSLKLEARPSALRR